MTNKVEKAFCQMVGLFFIYRMASKKSSRERLMQYCAAFLERLAA